MISQLSEAVLTLSLSDNTIVILVSPTTYHRNGSMQTRPHFKNRKRE